MPQPSFQDVQFMSADEKGRVYRAWLRFLRGGLKWSQFTKALYEHLIQHCSFIAHFNRHGFYETYFADGDSRIRFLKQFTTGVSTEYGMTYWLDGDNGDLNRAMCEAARPLASRLVEQAQRMQREADLTKARALAERHGVHLES